MNIEKICVYGAGSVGGFLAGELAKRGHTVSVIARGAHLAAIREKGLTVKTPDETYTVKPFATDNPAEVGKQDLVITVAKAHSLPAMAEGIRTLLGPETPVCFAQNGIPWWYFYGLEGPHKDRKLETLDPGGKLWDLVGPDRAVGTTINSPNEVIAPGVVHNKAKDISTFVVGEPKRSDTARVEAIAEAMRTPRVNVEVTTDIRTGVWNKLLVNLSTWAIAALTHAPSCDNMSNPELREVASRMMREGLAVARSFGLEPECDVDATMEKFGSSTPHKPSLLQDFEAGKPVEIDTVLKITREFGKLNGVPTPTMDILVPLVEQKARSLGLYGK
ncbi:MAG: ketopantoate reductase family protein [Acetobacterales bacterium]